MTFDDYIHAPKRIDTSILWPHKCHHTIKVDILEKHIYQHVMNAAASNLAHCVYYVNEHLCAQQQDQRSAFSKAAS